MHLEQAIGQTRFVRVQQRKELAEFFGFETRNKYEIRDDNGTVIGFAAEQGKDGLAILGRLFFGHWRRFQLHVFDSSRHLLWRLEHPFRFFFQRVEVYTASGAHLGALQQRWSILQKYFDVEGPNGAVVMTVSSPFWKPWTFPFLKNGREVASVQKKWSGLLKESFTDADNFHIQFESDDLAYAERTLILASAFFIDLQYFEDKANND